MSYTDEQYIGYDPFAGDRDTDIKCRTVKVVTVRKEQPCWEGLSPDLKPHTIKPGERARYEQAIVDGSWGRYYVCLPCMDRWFRDCGILPPQSSHPKRRNDE